MRRKPCDCPLRGNLIFMQDEELLVPKDEPQDVEQPHAEDHGMAETTQAE